MSEELLALREHLRYNLGYTKANGARSEPPHAALTSAQERLAQMADLYIPHSNTDSSPHSEPTEQPPLRSDEESPYDPANAIPDFDHARNTYHHLTPNRIEQFWNSMDKSGGEDACWNWKQATTYGEYYLGTHKESTHRLAYNLAFGDIPDGMEVCHTCDHPPCCNPKHLFLGTHQQNMRDQARKGRTGKTRGRTPGLNSIPNPMRRAETKKCGSRNPQAKLTEDDVRLIRKRYASGAVSQQELATDFHVHPSLIGFIVRRVYWQHVE